MLPRSSSAARRGASPFVLGVAGLLFAVPGAAGPVAAGPSEPAAAQEVFDHAHRLWAGVLADHVRDGRFDYRALRAERSRLDRTLLELTRVTPAQTESWSDAQRLAYFVVAYDAFVVHRVVEAWPIESLLDLSTDEESVWEQRTIPLGPHLAPGRELVSLDELEHSILRPRFRDARVHFALHHGTLGGPARTAAPLVAEDLSAQLDARTRAFLLDERRTELDREGGRVALSRVFEWFAADFERDAGSVAAFVRRHLPGDEDTWVETAELSYRPYDWALDAVPNEQAAGDEGASPGEDAE